MVALMAAALRVCLLSRERKGLGKKGKEGRNKRIDGRDMLIERQKGKLVVHAC